MGLSAIEAINRWQAFLYWNNAHFCQDFKMHDDLMQIILSICVGHCFSISVIIKLQ